MIGNMTFIIFIIESILCFLMVFHSLRKDTQFFVYTLQGAVVLFLCYCVFALIFFEVGVK